MFDKTAIIIDTKQETKSVRKLLKNMSINIDGIKGDCSGEYFVINNNYVNSIWRDSCVLYDYTMFTAQEFIDKYTSNQEVNRQELIVQLNYYQKKYANKIRETGLYMNTPVMSKKKDDLYQQYLVETADIKQKIKELEKQLGWEL